MAGGDTPMGAEGQRPSKLASFLLILAIVLVANSAYIAAFGDPTLFYVANGLIHPALGVIVAALFLVYFVRNRSVFRGWVATSFVLLLTLAAAAGIFLAFAGMTRPHSFILYAHVGTALAGLSLLLTWLRAQVTKAHIGPRSGVTPDSKVGESVPASARARVASARSAWRWSAAVSTASLGFYCAVALYHHHFPNAQYTIRNPATPPLSMEQEGGGTDNFMFPSSAQTPDNKPINSQFFMDSESCRRCHADIYDQWQSSMHHFASFNNQWYRKSIEYMQDVNGIKPSLWCGGCHDHALILAGKMQKHPIREIENT